MKQILIGLAVVVALIIMIVVGITVKSGYNTKTHSDDVTMTEWISPDGVHYWYQMTNHHAMLAPRYDSNGNLVIDK